MRSVDLGVTWANITVPAVDDGGYSDIKYDPYTNLFIVVGAVGQMSVSRDGQVWRSVRRDAYTALLNGVAIGDSTCVMVGNTSALRQSLNFPWSY